MISNVFSQRDFSGGLNSSFEPWQIENNEIPFVKNMSISKRGSIGSVYGYKASGSAGTSSILGLFPFYTTAGARYLVRIYGTTVEYTTTPTAASPTWSPIETLGSTGGRFAAVQYDDKLWYGDGVLDFRRWNGTAVTTDAAAPKGNVMAVWRSQCWIAGNTTNPSTVYYSGVDDFTTWSGGTSGSITVNKKDGQAIRGLVPLGDNLIVFKERSIWKISYEFDDVTSTNFYSVTEVSSHHGSISPRTALLVNNDASALSSFGIVSVGQEANYSGLRTNVLSEKIRNDLRTATLGGAINQDNAINSAAAFFEDRLYISIPVGTATNPNDTYVYDSLYNAWTFLEGVGANIFCIFRDSQLEDFLFFGSSDGNVYYFSLVHSFGSIGFTKQFKTKRYNLDNPGVKKEIYSVSITGAKALGAEINCTYNRDYTSEEFVIDDDDLIQDSSGGYVGENVFGDSYFGGTGVSDGVTQYRFRKTFFPDERGCFEFQLEFLNEAADEPFSVDSVQVYYDTLDLQENSNFV